jgi:hypothetical protein
MADDIYSLLMSDEATAAERAQAMSAALRRQRAAGNLALLTGDKVLGNFGQAQLQGAGTQEGLLAQAGQQRAGQAMQRENHVLQRALQREQLERQQGRDAEAARHNRAVEAQGRPPPFVIVSGEGGGQYFVDPRNPRAQAMPVTGPDGKPILKQGPSERGTEVMGLEKAEGASPTVEDAKKVKASLASAERMKRYVDELRALHAKHGTEYGGAVANRMSQLKTQIHLESKNIGELGALSGPDMGMVESIAGVDPSGLGDNLKAMVGVDNTQTALDGLSKWVDDTLSANMETYGYRRPGNGKAAAHSLAAEDAAALEWAKANPSDQRAAAILKLHGAP